MSNKPNIPGISVCPVDEDDCGSGIEIESFSEKIFIPEAHMYGHCRKLNEFERLSIISEGTFGVLYKCRDKKDNKIVALKKLKMPPVIEEGIPFILREISILNSLKHLNIINLYGTVAGRNLEKNYLIMDYCLFSLKELFEKNVEAIHNKAMVKSLIFQILQGLQHIHAGLIIHRNISSKNIMFTDQGILKIGGFYSSRFYSKSNMTPGVTELYYRAPELLFQSKLYGPAVDMWSAGCIFAHLLLKKPLFTGNSEMDVIRSIFQVLGTPSETVWPGFQEVFSKMDREEAVFEVLNEHPYSGLKSYYFEDLTAASKALILDLIVYFPNARLSAPECLKSHYFMEIPIAFKTEDLAEVLRSVMSSSGSSAIMETN